MRESSRTPGLTTLLREVSKTRLTEGDFKDAFVGIGIGIGISNIYDGSSPTALIMEGVFNAASAGILIYMSLVDLLAADFMKPKMQSNGRLQAGANISLLLGAGCVSLLAK